MTELLYLSTAKLERWPSRPGVAARTGLELGGGVIPAKLVVSPAGATTPAGASHEAHERLKRALKDLESSDRFARWVSDPAAGPGQWIEFDGVMRYGRVSRDSQRASADPSANIVLFVGSFGSPDREVDVLLGGWIGHLLDEAGRREPGFRMGSRTDDLYDLWNELAEQERHGMLEIPSRWRRLGRELGPSDDLDLGTLCRWVYSMMDSHLPHEAAVPLKGHAQVLARLKNEHERSLLVGTPLYLEFSLPPEVPASAPGADVSRPALRRPWWRRRHV